MAASSRCEIELRCGCAMVAHECILHLSMYNQRDRLRLMPPSPFVTSCPGNFELQWAARAAQILCCRSVRSRVSLHDLHDLFIMQVIAWTLALIIGGLNTYLVVDSIRTNQFGATAGV